MAKKRVTIFLSDDVINEVENVTNEISAKFGVKPTVAQVIASEVERIYGAKVKVE